MKPGLAFFHVLRVAHQQPRYVVVPSNEFSTFAGEDSQRRRNFGRMEKRGGDDQGAPRRFCADILATKKTNLESENCSNKKRCKKKYDDDKHLWSSEAREIKSPGEADQQSRKSDAIIAKAKGAAHNECHRRAKILLLREMELRVVALFKALLAYAAVAAAANLIDDACPQHVVFGAPISGAAVVGQHLCNDAFALHFRYDTKTAEYVVYRPRPSTRARAPARRDFRMDTRTPAEFCVNHVAMPPGVTRGHLAPAASVAAEDHDGASFFFTNVVPQDAVMNHGVWARIEERARAAARLESDVFVVAGTLHEDRVEDRVVVNGAAMPTHLWQVFFHASAPMVHEAYLVPNAAPASSNLRLFATSLEEIEARARVLLFPRWVRSPAPRKPWACSCGRAFAWRDGLLVHERKKRCCSSQAALDVDGERRESEQ